MVIYTKEKEVTQNLNTQGVLEGYNGTVFAYGQVPTLQSFTFYT
jgi:hypothetical protein